MREFSLAFQTGLILFPTRHLQRRTAATTTTNTTNTTTTTTTTFRVRVKELGLRGLQLGLEGSRGGLDVGGLR
jgi:hypothetical protein